MVLGRSLTILPLYVTLKVSLTMGDPDRTISSDSCHIFLREVSLQYPWSVSISSLGHTV